MAIPPTSASSAGSPSPPRPVPAARSSTSTVKPGRSRDRDASVLDVDRITVGARYFGFPPDIRGFLDGDILQVLVYDRVLDEAERREVEDYLAARLGGKGPIRGPTGRAAASRWSPSRTRRPCRCSCRASRCGNCRST